MLRLSLGAFNFLPIVPSKHMNIQLEEKKKWSSHTQVGSLWLYDVFQIQSPFIHVFKGENSINVAIDDPLKNGGPWLDLISFQNLGLRDQSLGP